MVKNHQQRKWSILGLFKLFMDQLLKMQLERVRNRMEQLVYKKMYEKEFTKGD